MIFDSILKKICEQVDLTQEETNDFCSLLTVKKIKRKGYLIRQGEICLYENFINSGCFRTYYLDNAGLQHNVYFASEGWWLSDIHSRTYQFPSFCNIVAIEDSEIIQISQIHLEQYLIKVPKLERFFRVLYQRSIAAYQLKVLQMLHMTAEERYTYFREKYPQFDQRIPQKHIATYLGLTPEFFNTIRTRVLRNS